MVSTYSSASPSSWRPTSRALGALFAGSAVMFTAAVVQGGSPFGSENEVAPAAEPAVKESSVTSRSSAPDNSARTSAPAALAPGQAAPWTPGAKPDWGSTLAELPVRRAPVREAPQPHAATAPSPAENSGRPDGWRDGPAPGGSVSDSSRIPPAEQSDGGVIDDMLGYLSTRMGP